MIKIENLCKSYGSINVLKGIDLNIREGEIYGLIGRSGAGKSTLLRCINKLEDFQSGQLLIGNKNIANVNGKDLRLFRKNIGMIFQHFSLMERRTVYDNIALPMECWNYDKKTIDQKIKNISRMVEIEDKLENKPSELSGGQKQRVAIARALAMDSKILLSDEATSALDPKTTDSILDLLIRINEELGITIVVVAHQMEVIKKICDRVAVLKDGELVIDGKTSDVFIKQQAKINEVLGGGSLIKLPDEGINIKIISSEETRDKKILSSLAKDTQVTYSVPSANIEHFKDGEFAILYININEKDLNTVSGYLDKNGMIWEVV